MPQNSRWRILVEARKDVAFRRSLDAIAETISSAGYHVVRWRGPQSGRVRYSRILWNCDIAVLCNGTTSRYRSVLQHLAIRGTDVFYIELGWYPQAETLQIDPSGINADASWCGQPLPRLDGDPLTVRSTGDLLVLLQHEQDTQITRQSPHFQNMTAFLAHLAAHSVLPLRVRRHPKFPPGPDVEAFVRANGLTWDSSPSLEASMNNCRAVACINSSGAVAALAAGLPVLCFGRAVYRQPHAVYCLDRDGPLLRQVTGELAAGHSRLGRGYVRAMFRRIVNHQWRPEDLSQRLVPMVDATLRGHRRPQSAGALTCWDCLRSASTWWSTYLRPKLQGGT